MPVKTKFHSTISTTFHHNNPITKVKPIKKDRQSKQMMFRRLSIRESEDRTIIETISYKTTVQTMDEGKNSYDEPIPFYYGFLGLLGLIIGAILSSIVLLIPHPEHWYTYGLLYSIGVGFGLTINFGLVQPSYWMDVNFFQNWHPFISRFLIVSISLFATNGLCNMFWTVFEQQNYPMPMNYFVSTPVSFWIMHGTLWIHFTKLEKEKTIMRYKWFLLSQVVIVGCFWVYLGMGLALTRIATERQWIMAILFAIVREINQAILSRVCCRISKRSDKWVKISAWHWMAAVNSIFIAVAISSVATLTTSYLVLAIDFFLNMFVCIQVIWKFRRNGNKLNDDINMSLDELVLNEKLEAIIPLGYCLCYLMAYYGPNQNYLGNIAESDAEKTMKMTGLLFLIDISSLIVSAILLWAFCKINLLKVYLKSQKELWLIMASQEAYLLYEVK